MATRGHVTRAGQASFFDPAISTAFLSGLWRTCPLLEYLCDPTIGVYLNDSCTEYYAAATTGDWVLTQATAGSAAMSTTAPGTIALDSGSTTNTQGAQIQRVKSMFIPAANKSVWAEFRVSGTTSITGEYFIGLAAIDTTIIASSAMSTNNRIGWTSVTDDGVLLFDCDKAGTASTGIAATTLSTSTPHNLGFVYDGVADTVQQYIDGVATGAAIATANIPKLAIYPSFVCQTSGTTQPVLNIHGFRVFQLR